MQRVQKALAAIGNQKQVTGAREGQARPAAQHLPVPQHGRHRAERRIADGGAAADDAGNGSRVPAAAWNVLAEDYWDLYTLLLR